MGRDSRDYALHSGSLQLIDSHLVPWHAHFSRVRTTLSIARARPIRSLCDLGCDKTKEKEKISRSSAVGAWKLKEEFQ